MGWCLNKGRIPSYQLGRQKYVRAEIIENEARRSGISSFN